MSKVRDAIKAVILQELGQTDAKGTVVCLTGAWGCGKTHLWNEVALDLKNVSERVVGYVSLFGVGSLTEARTAVVNALVLDRLARDAGDAKKLAVRLGTWATQKMPAALAGFVNSRVGAEVLTRNLDLSRMIPEGSILCLDDLERISSSFPLQDALGYANHLAEQRDCRVLVIMNEEHLDPRFGQEQADLIRAYRERIVRSYLKLEMDLSDVVPHLTAPKSLAARSVGIVVETLERARCSNVRTLIRALEAVSRAHGLTKIELNDEELRFMTALTAEHAAGTLKPDPAEYDFHPVVFEIDARRNKPEKDADKKVFYRKYFDGAGYRADAYLHGLVSNGYLDVGPYLAARHERLSPPPTALGRLLRRIAEREHLYLSDQEAVEWITATERLISASSPPPSAAQISTLYTVAHIVAHTADIQMGASILSATERALVAAAGRGDTSLKDPFGVPADTRVPPPILERYKAEVERVALASFYTRAGEGILARDAAACRAAIRDGNVLAAAEHFMDAPLLRALHDTLASDRRFYLEVLSILLYVITEYHEVVARQRLVGYLRATLDGTLATFLDAQLTLPTLDNSARSRLRALLRELGADPDAAPSEVASVL